MVLGSSPILFTIGPKRVNLQEYFAIKPISFSTSSSDGFSPYEHIQFFFHKNSQSSQHFHAVQVSIFLNLNVPLG